MLIIATSAPFATAASKTAELELRDILKAVGITTFEVWYGARLCELLRTQPEPVASTFGIQKSEAFCITTISRPGMWRIVRE